MPGITKKTDKRNSPEHKAMLRRIGASGGKAKTGVKHKTTIDREMMLETIKDIGASRAKTLINVQTLLAVGTISVYVIRSHYEGKRKIKDKPELITDDETIINVLDFEYGEGENPNSDEEYFFVQKNIPDNSAINSLLDRTFGRATENKKITVDKGMGELLDEIEED